MINRKAFLTAILAASIINIQGQVWLWANGANNQVISNGSGICVTMNDRLGVSGSFFSNPLPIGGFTLANSGNQDGFVASMSKAGAVLWAAAIGGSANENVTSIACDLNGNFYAVGVFSSPFCNFGTQSLTLAGSSDGFVAKYDSMGVLQWLTHISGPGQDRVNAVSADAAGNVYITGQTDSGMLVVNSATHSPGTTGRMFTAKINPQGQSVWVVISGGNGPQDKPMDIRHDQAGNLYVAGHTHSGIFSAGQFTHTFLQPGAPTFRFFFMKYDNLGNVLWLQGSSTNSVSEGIGVAIDKMGNLYSGGSFFGNTMVVGNYSFTNPGTRSAFVAKHSVTTGAVQWAQTSKGNDTFAMSLTSADSSVFLAGGGTYPVAFTGAQFTSTASPAQWLVEFNQNGSLSCGTSVDHAQFRKLSVGTGERLYIAGDYLGGPLALDQHTLAQGNSNVMFAAKYSCDCINGFSIQSSDEVLCELKTAVLTSGAGVTYTWNTGANTQTIAVAPLQTTTYSVSVTSPDGCIQNGSFTQVVSPCDALPDQHLSAHTLFPNPVSEGEALQVGLLSAGACMSLTDLSGNCLISNADLRTLRNKVDGLEPGIYLVYIRDRNSLSVHKLIKR
jgi:hypothetical protein